MVYHVPEQHDECKRHLCGVQRQKEAQEAQAAQEARHEQAKRKAKLEAGFAEVSATALIKQQWLMTATQQQFMTAAQSAVLFVSHNCSACVCRQWLALLHQSQDRKSSAQSGMHGACWLSTFVVTTHNVT